MHILEKAMAPHSSTFAWKIPWTEEPGRLQSMRSLRVRHDWAERLHFPFSLSCIGEGNGNPLQNSGLENPRDGGSWQAAIYGVTQSQTGLKRLSSSSSNAYIRKLILGSSYIVERSAEGSWAIHWIKTKLSLMGANDMINTFSGSLAAWIWKKKKNLSKERKLNWMNLTP